MKTIEVSNEIYNRIMDDKKHFTKTIGGGEWMEEDVIKEYQKIMDTFK